MGETILDITKKRIVYELPGMEDLAVRRGIEYRQSAAGPLTLDLYYPPAAEALRPAVVIVLGYRDAGVKTFFGCQFREMGMIVSWCRLFAASGMIGVAYETENPADDAPAVLRWLKENGHAFGIDGNRVGIWTSSGNAPVALSVLMDGHARCGVICYGITIDLDGATGVAGSAAQFHFANPTAGRRVEDLPRDTPLFIARAGRDQFTGLNEALDSFVAAALRCNLPLTFVNHPAGPHGFDYDDDSEASRNIIRAILSFLRANLDA